MKIIFTSVLFLLLGSSLFSQDLTSNSIEKVGQVVDISSDRKSGSVILHDILWETDDPIIYFEPDGGHELRFSNPSSIDVTVGDMVSVLEIKGRSIPENSLEIGFDNEQLLRIIQSTPNSEKVIIILKTKLPN